MATTAQFTATSNTKSVRITGASAVNTARDGSGTEGTTIFQCFIAGANGSRIDKIAVAACGTLAASTAGMLRFFISDGTNKRLWRELVVTVTTPSASVVGFNNYTTADSGLPLFLPTGYSLWVTSHYADSTGNQFDITCIGGDW